MSESKHPRRWLHAAVAGTGLSAVLIFGLSGCNGCNSGQQTAAPIANGANTAPADNSAADPNGQDPAMANMAEGAMTAASTSAATSRAHPTKVLGAAPEQYNPQQSGESYPEGQQAPAPIVNGYTQQDQQAAYSQGYDDAAAAGEQAIADANQAPPPLPEYDQPPAPDPNYIWTPGYWSYGADGYYWVPGAWVAPPYYGALWTPPYWGWYSGRYHFYHGYWGPHVGFYGGINYGFGYIGTGYFGGYWRGHDFFYNRAVTHVGPGMRNFYERPVVVNNVHYGPNITNRVSYNGGRGGINARPSGSEIAAMHEAHYAPTQAQRQDRMAAAGNRSQAFSQNHGAPAMAANSHAVGERGGIGNAHPNSTINHVAPGTAARSFGANQPNNAAQRQNIEQQRLNNQQERQNTQNERLNNQQERVNNQAERENNQQQRQELNTQRNNEMQQRNQQIQQHNEPMQHPNPAEQHRGGFENQGGQPHNNPAPQPHMEAPHTAPQPHMEAPHPAPGGGGRPEGAGGHPGGHH